MPNNPRAEIAPHPGGSGTTEMPLTMKLSTFDVPVVLTVPPPSEVEFASTNRKTTPALLSNPVMALRFSLKVVLLTVNVVCVIA